MIVGSCRAQAAKSTQVFLLADVHAHADRRTPLSARCSVDSRVCGKKYGREDAVNGWLDELERPPPVTGDTNGTPMTDGLPQTPAQQPGAAPARNHWSMRAA